MDFPDGTVIGNTGLPLFVADTPRKRGVLYAPAKALLFGTWMLVGPADRREPIRIAQ